MAGSCENAEVLRDATGSPRWGQLRGFGEIGGATFRAGATDKGAGAARFGVARLARAPRKVFRCNQVAGLRFMPGAPAPQWAILPITPGTEDTIRCALPADKPVDVR